MLKIQSRHQFDVLKTELIIFGSLLILIQNFGVGGRGKNKKIKRGCFGVEGVHSKERRSKSQYVSF